LRVSMLRGERVEVFDFMTNPESVRPQTIRAGCESDGMP
jgi:hypothetical protein